LAFDNINFIFAPKINSNEIGADEFFRKINTDGSDSKGPLKKINIHI